MTSVVYCDLGKEHPCPKANDVRGLLRFGKRASMPKSLMTSVVYCDLGKEHPYPKPNDVRGLLRFGKRASMPKAQ